MRARTITRLTCFPRLVLALAALIACVCATSAQPQELGRLFFTPQQRQELDRRRDTNVVEREAVVQSLITVNGNVTRSSGKTTTWINGVPQYDAAGGRDPSRPIIIEGDYTIHVKVGQTYDRVQGETHDPLGTGEIHIAPAPPK
jgi:hypothetical protein